MSDAIIAESIMISGHGGDAIEAVLESAPPGLD